MTLEIRPLGFSRRDRRRFVRVSFDLHRADPNWVPPLWIDVLGELNPAKNPFFEHATVQHLLALRDGVAVGRIAAIVNHRHNEFHDARDAHFGWFEAADEEVANELLAAAEAWAAERGTERVLGPVSYSTNDVCGLLVDGFDVPPAILMPYNPRATATGSRDAASRRPRTSSPSTSTAGTGSTRASSASRSASRTGAASSSGRST
jgi:hypothetical protein